MNGRRRHSVVRLYLLGLILGTIAPRVSAEVKEPNSPRIECEVSIPCTAEEAWEAWTTAKGLESFLARSARVTLEEGGEYSLNFGGTGSGDIRRSRSPRILRVDAPRSLTFEWVIPLPDAATRDPMTVVTVRIEPISSQRSRVHLEHTGWAAGEEKSDAYTYSQRAWKMALRNLRNAASRIQGQTPPYPAPGTAEILLNRKVESGHLPPGATLATVASSRSLRLLRARL